MSAAAHRLVQHDSAVLDHEDLGADQVTGDDPRVQALLEQPQLLLRQADVCRRRVRERRASDRRELGAREARTRGFAGRTGCQNQGQSSNER